MTTTIPEMGIISGQTVNRIRRTGDAYVSGRLVNGAEASTPHSASVQMPSGKTAKFVQQLSEGERLQDWIIVFSLPDTFRTSDGALGYSADIIEYDSLRYEVKAIRKWRGRILTHDQTYALRLP